MAGTEHDSPIAAAEPVVDLTAAAPGSAAAEVPPELLAQSLGQYLRAWLQRIRSGDSGVLPVLLGIVVVAIAFQIANGKFLSPQNLVNLFEQSTIYMLLAMAEIFALLLGEIDLSVGLVMGLGAVLVAEMVQPGGLGLPWWVAIILTLLLCAFVGLVQGSLVARTQDAVVHRHPGWSADPRRGGDHRPGRQPRRYRQLALQQRGGHLRPLLRKVLAGGQLDSAGRRGGRRGRLGLVPRLYNGVGPAWWRRRQASPS